MAAWAVVGLLIAWNAGFMLQWGTNMVPNRGPVNFAEVTRNQFTVVPRAAWQFFSGAREGFAPFPLVLRQSRDDGKKSKN